MSLRLLIGNECSRVFIAPALHSKRARAAKQSFVPRKPSEMFSLEGHLDEMLAAMDGEELRWLFLHLPEQHERSLFHRRVEAEGLLRLTGLDPEPWA